MLQRAVTLLGSERALARHLRVPMPELFGWLRGDDLPPQAIFFAAVDLLIERDDLDSLSPSAPVAPAQTTAAEKNPDQ